MFKSCCFLILQRGNLLLALDQTESRDSGTSSLLLFVFLPLKQKNLNDKKKQRLYIKDGCSPITVVCHLMSLFFRGVS